MVRPYPRGGFAGKKASGGEVGKEAGGRHDERHMPIPAVPRTLTSDSVQTAIDPPSHSAEGPRISEGKTERYTGLNGRLRYRNLVERFFSKLKHFRTVTTHYEKHDVNYLALVKLAASGIWMRFCESVT